MTIPEAMLSDCLTRWGGPLTAWLRGRCSHPEDLVQEAFCRLYLLPALPDRPGAWLFRVAGNLLREEYRSNARRRVREIRYAPRESVSATSIDPQMVELQQAVERLDPSLKDVVIARTWGGLTLSETAEVLGISTTTAHRRYQEALEHLRNLLNQSET